MARASPAMTSFNAGVLSPTLDARIDLDFYRNGCSVLENFIPTVQGPARFRGGTLFVDGALNSAQRSWLARFEFNYEQAYLLEFSGNRVGFFSNRGRVVVTRTITNVANDAGFCRYTSAGHGLVTGQTVTITGVGGVPNANGTYQVVVINANEFGTLAAFSGAYTSGGSLTGAYTVATPYTDVSLLNPDGSCALSRVQVGDIVYLAGAGAAPQTLSRTAPTAWTLAAFQPNDGPYLAQNESEALTVYASAVTGAVTLTSSSALFTANHVGALIRIAPLNVSVDQWTPTVATFSVGTFCRYGQNFYECVATGGGANNGTTPPTHTVGEDRDGHGTASRTWKYLHSGYGVARITGFTSSTSVSATVLSRLPANVVGAGNATWRWRMGAWGAHNEWPTRVTLWRDRLVFSGLRTVWMSQSNDFDSFAPDEFGVTTALSAITIQPASTDNNAIRWLAPADALLIGTASTEFAAAEITTSDPLGPDNIKVVPVSKEGGRAVIPAQDGATVLYGHRSGGLRQIQISESGRYESSDTTARNPEILAAGVVDMAFQTEPDSAAWLVTAGGDLVGLTFESEQQVIGWHRHALSGVVESVQTLPAPDNTSDDVWVVVRRTVGGTVYRTVERLSVPNTAGDPYLFTYLDCCVSFDGIKSGTLTLAGAWNTVGATVTATNSVAAFASTDVGRVIHHRYQDSAGVWRSAKAQITAYTSATQVTAAVLVAFPVASFTGWRLAANQVTGIPAVLSTTRAAVVNGAPLADAGVSTTLAVDAGAVVHVGFPYVGKLRTMRVEAGSQEGVAQGKVKRVSKVVVRMLASAGLRAGPDFTRLDELVRRQPSDAMDEPLPLFSGDALIEWPSGYETDGYVCVEQSQPLPATVVGLFPQVNTSDR